MTPATPHAIVAIERSGLTDVQASVRYDSWEAKGLFKSIEVELVLDESSRAKITFFDPDYGIIDAFSDYTVKAKIKIYLGYGQDMGEPIFTGLLTDIDRRRGETVFTVADNAFPMKLVKRTGYKNKKDDLAIIADLITGKDGKTAVRKYPDLLFNPPPTPKKLEAHKAMTQDEQTDWEHMMERAKQSGLHIFIRQNTVFARYPSDYSKSPVMTINVPTAPKLLNGWDFTYHTIINRDAKPKEVVHRRRGQAGKRAEGSSSVSAKAEVSHLSIKQDIPTPSKSKLSKRAQAQKELEREHAFEANVQTIFPAPGEPRPDVLDVVAIRGNGKLLSGDYITETARYRFGPGELSMALEMYRDVKDQ